MQNTNFGQSISNRLIHSGLALRQHGWGCTLDEIEKLKQVQQVNYLPPLYIEFLLEMGKGTSSPLFQGEDYTYDCLLKLKSEVISITERIKEYRGMSFLLPETAFVFFGHQGAAYWYFDTNDRNPDPPVYLFDEEDENFVSEIGHPLSLFFISQVEDLIVQASRAGKRLREKLRDLDKDTE